MRMGKGNFCVEGVIAPVWVSELAKNCKIGVHKKRVWWAKAGE